MDCEEKNLAFLRHEVSYSITMKARRMKTWLVVLSFLIALFVVARIDGRAQAAGPFSVLAPLVGNEHKLPNAPRVIPVEEAYPHGYFPPYPPQASAQPTRPARFLRLSAEEAARQRYYRTQQALATQPIRYPWGYFGARGGDWSAQQTDYYGTYSETLFSRGAH